MLKKFKTLLCLASCLLVLHGCKPEELYTDGIKMDEINPEYAIPLISDEVSIGDLIKSSNSLIKIDATGFMSLVYRGQIFSSTAGEKILVADQGFSQNIALTSSHALALNSGQPQTIAFQANQSFSLGSREIDSIWLKAGALAASISSEIRTGGNLKITFEDAKNLSTVLSLDVPFSYGGSIPVVASNTRALAGYKWNMTKGGSGYNNVNIKFELTLNATNEPVAAGEQMNISMAFTGIKFHRFYGYIGQVNLLTGGDTIDISVFDKATGGQFTIEDPRLKIVAGNSFGVPVQAGFSKLAGYTSGTGGFYMDITGFPDPMPVNTPTMAQMGEMVYDSATINNSNSNIKTIINQKPKQVIFECYVNLNPGGKLQRNFVTDQSQIKFIVEVELPLHGSARGFVIEKESDVNTKMPEEEMIDEMLLRFTGDNGYPIDLGTQVYLMDSNSVIFDSIFVNKDYKFIAAASVGTDGKVTSSTKKTTDIIFDHNRAKRLSKLKKVKIRAEIGTTSAGGTYPSVKLYNNYQLGVKIGMKAKLKINSDLLDSLGSK